MRLPALLCFSCLLPVLPLSVAATFTHDMSPLHLHAKRDAQYIVEMSSSNPVAAAEDVQKMAYLPNNASAVIDWGSQLIQGTSDDVQLPWNSAVPFTSTPNADLDTAGGWKSLPPLQGFQLNRTWEVVPGAIMPFYITSGLQAVNVKRAIVAWPGKPRDSWRYANLYRNALSVVEADAKNGVQKNSVLIIAPAWMNDLDHQAGAVLEREIYFHGSGWEYGGSSRGPQLPHALSAFTIVDNFTDMLFDRTLYPNLNQVVIAGHSMGGQAAHRYAVLKKQKRYDDNMSYWVANPGSWTYLSSERPYHNDSCPDSFDSYHYGIGQNLTKMTKYARKDVVADKDAVVKRYLSRKVHMALGLLDVGPGDTHCEARDQGASHLDRGSQYILHLAQVNGGTFPPAQTVDFIGNTSHQDYPMISSNSSLKWLFLHNYAARYPDIVNPSNPGDRVKKIRPPKPHRPHAFATKGNITLATTLLAGSLLSVLVFFVALPFLFTANLIEETQHERRYAHLSDEQRVVSFQHRCSPSRFSDGTIVSTSSSSGGGPVSGLHWKASL